MINLKDTRLRWSAAALAVIVLTAASGNINWNQIRSAVKHGTSAYGQSSDGTGTSGHTALFNSEGSLTNGPIPANYTQTFSSQTSVTLTHDLGTTSVVVQCFDNSSPPNLIGPLNIALTDSNDVTVTFSTSQSGSCTVNGGGAMGTGGLYKSGPYLTDGSNYYLGYNLFPATLPVSASFAWVNQGSGTETSNGGALTLYAPERSTGCTSIPCDSVNLILRTQAISTYTTLTVAMQCTQHFWPYASCGIGFYESATGKIETIDIGPNDDAVLSNAIGVNRYTNTTTFSATESGTGAIFPQTLFFRIVKSGGSLTWYWSNDGFNWSPTFTESYTAFFTTAPDHWFYFNDNEYGEITGKNTDAWATLLSWSVQ